jgi:hypothetical protein
MKNVLFYGDVDKRGEHSIYITTGSSSILLSGLLNWFNLDYGPFGQNNMQHAMVIQVVEFSSGRNKIRKIFA